MKARIHWGPRAQGDLARIAAHIETRDPTLARQCLQRIRDRVRQLRDFPESGRAVPEYERSDVRELIVLRWRVIYRYDPHRIDVLNVFDAARQLPDDPPGDPK